MPPWVYPTLFGAVVTGMIGFGTYLVRKINALEVSMARAEVQLVPLSAMIQAQLLSLLHHEEPRYAEPDALIDKLSHHPASMTEAESLRLRQLMKQRQVADVPEIERRRAAALLAYMDIVILEKEAFDSSGKITGGK